MATLASLLVKLGLSASEFHEGLDKAEGRASSASGNIVSSLLKIGGAVAGFTLVKRGAEMVVDALGSFATEAMAAQDCEAQLDAVLKSTGAAAAQQAEAYAAAKGKMVSSTALSSAALADLNQKLTDTQLKYNTLTTSIQEQKQRIIDLTARYGENGLATLTAKNRLAEMQNQAGKLNGEMASLSDQIAKGSVVTTQTLASKLGLLSPAARMSKDELLALADSLQNVTRFEDDTIIGGESLMLTFTNVGREIFPEATERALDMSQALGQDLQSSVTMLGKALQDPILGVTALRRVGVNFSESQQTMIEKLVKTGDLLGAQKMILKELNTEFGGSARAAGQTAAGQWDIFRNKLGNVKEYIGKSVLPALGGLGGKLSEALSNPAVQAGIDKVAQGVGLIATKIGDVAGKLLQGDIKGALAELVPQPVVDKAMQLATTVGDFVTNSVIPFATQHAPALKSALIAILAVLGGFVILSTIASLVGMITNPVFLIIAAVGLLAAAWTEDWGGIRTWLTAFWESTLKPILTQLWTWLQTNIPVAIAFLAGFWTNTLQPAITAVWNFIQANVLPLLGQLWTWLQTNIPLALQALSNFWTNTLLPAITAVWSWIQTNLVPLFQSLANLAEAVVGKAIEALAGLWQNVLGPAIQDVGKWIGDKLIPWLTDLADKVRKGVGPALEWLKNEILEPVLKVFDKVGEILEKIIGWINELIEKIKGLTLPDWLTPGSPAPIENATRGWSAALRELATTRLPALQFGLQALPAVAAVQPAAGRGEWGGGDTYNVYVYDQATGKLVMAMIDDRRRERLNAGMGG